MKLLSWIESTTPEPIMVQIAPYSCRLRPDSEAVQRRQERIDALIEAMGPKWAGHRDFVKVSK